MSEFTEAELLGNGEAPADVDDDVAGLGEELDTAITGTTMTDLKLQVRKLQRELEAVRKNEADASRVLVLENLLEDANRMKARYEADYLAAHREKLILQNDLEEIRSGKSLGDGYVLFNSNMYDISDERTERRPQLPFVNVSTRPWMSSTSSNKNTPSLRSNSKR